MEQQDTIYIPAGGGHKLQVLDSTHYTKVAPAVTGGQFTALEIVIPPDCGPPMHSHATDSEFFYVLDGTLTISVPEGDIKAGPGDFCFLRAGGHHGFRNETQSEVRALVVITPGIEAHRFFTEVDARVAGTSDMPLTIDLADRNGIRFAA